MSNIILEGFRMRVRYAKEDRAKGDMESARLWMKQARRWWEIYRSQA